ncbi:MAG TPA: hypothetical protein DDX98_13740 [Bacteroidales bacterium]|nr:hypothetical protein [Bacteroidales bacterium]
MKLRFTVAIILCTLSSAMLIAQTWGEPVTDIDGNEYKTVQIGNQIWMAENLKTTKYNDGTEIPLVTENYDWASYNLDTPGYCWYDNDIATYGEKYGALYNWYAVNTGKLCPVGWHVPTDEEWTQLSDYYGGVSNLGGKLKETGTSHWVSPNTGATNETGFTALPGGSRNISGNFGSTGYLGIWWSATEHDTYYNAAWSRYVKNDEGLFYNSRSGNTNHIHKGNGFSVRCVKENTSNSAYSNPDCLKQVAPCLESMIVTWCPVSKDTVGIECIGDACLAPKVTYIQDYEIAYKEQSATNWETYSYSLNGTEFAPMSPKAKISNLKPGTNYEVKVRGLINENNYTDYSDVSIFSTACATVSLADDRYFWKTDSGHKLRYHLRFNPNGYCYSDYTKKYLANNYNIDVIVNYKKVNETNEYIEAFSLDEDVILTNVEPSSTYYVTIQTSCNGIVSEPVSDPKIMYSSPEIFDETADLSASRDSIVENDSVQFMSHCSLSDINYNWTFEGDSIIQSNEQNPVINFETPGQYTVSLEITDSLGNIISDTTITIFVEDYKPVEQPFQSAPFDLEINNINLEHLTLAWKDSSTINTNYIIERSILDQNEYYPINLNLVFENQYVDTNLIPGLQVIYRVRSETPDGALSNYSELLKVMMPQIETDMYEITYSIDEEPADNTIIDTLSFFTNNDGNTKYSIIGGEYSSNFAVNASNGEFKVLNGSLLDYETQTEYVLYIQGINEISGSIIVTVIVSLNNVDEEIVSIENTTSQEHVKVFPNPTKGYITIKLNNQARLSNIKIFNSAGQAVIDKKYNNAKEVHLNLEFLNNGVYFVLVNNNKGQFLSKKIILKK